MSGTLATEISVSNVKNKENEENIAFFRLLLMFQGSKNRTFSFLFLVPTVMTFASDLTPIGKVDFEMLRRPF
jgi:hypothetical protein